MMFDVDMLPAENGDCLWIEYGDPKQPHRLLIDCGAVSTATLVESRIEAMGRSSLQSQPFELFVLTHIDADHISGVLPLFRRRDIDGCFKDIWFNGWRQVNPFLSVGQAEAFTRLLQDPARGLPWNRAINPNAGTVPGPIVVTPGVPPPSFELSDGLRLTVLSPGPGQLERLGRDWQQVLDELTPKPAMLGRKVPPPAIANFDRFDLDELARQPEKRDTSVPNGSSIALLAEFDGQAVLLAGDAYPEVIVSSIETLQKSRGRAGERLKLDALKVSHHGSTNATSTTLLNAIDCHRYLISTNGNIFYHPDRDTIARIILRGGAKPTLVFNYRSPYNQLWETPSLQTRYRYQTIYPPADTPGLRVSLRGH